MAAVTFRKESRSSVSSQPPSYPSKRKWPWRKTITPFSTLIEHKYPGRGTESNPYVLDWIPDSYREDGTEQVVDLEYPQTWAARYKWGITMIGAISVLSVTMTSSMMSAAIFNIRQEFPNHTPEMYIMVTSIFILGFVVGPLVWAPASEVFGRRRMFIATFLPFTIFNAACCGANSLEVLLVFRFLAGTFGSSTLTSVGGVITDMFNMKDRAAAMGVFAIAPFLGPAIGPVAGGFLSEASSWKWVAALLAFFSAILTIIGALLLPETYEPVLLRRRAADLSKITGNVYRYSRDVTKPLVTKDLFKKQLTVPWKLLFTEPVAFLMAIYVSVVYAILYMQFTSFPIVFVQQRHWTPAIAGLAFIGLSVGAVLGLILLGVMNKSYASKLEANGGFLPPEERLPMVILGGILLPVGLFWFAWTSPNNIHWIVPILATVVFGAALVGLFLGIMSYLTDAYTIYAASALAGNTVMRSIFGVVFPLFTSRMYDALGVQWAGSVIAFIALAFIPAPIIFYKYGGQIRLKSRFAREADEANRALAEKLRQKSQSALNSRMASRAASATNVATPPANADDFAEKRSLSSTSDSGKGIGGGSGTGRVGSDGRLRGNVEDDVEMGLREAGGVEGFPVVGVVEEKLTEVAAVREKGQSHTVPSDGEQMGLQGEEERDVADVQRGDAGQVGANAPSSAGRRDSAERLFQSLGAPIR